MKPALPLSETIEDCVELTYRTPAQSVNELIPDGLELITRGPWAFWSVQALRVEKARPVGIPAMCGVSYHRINYRLAVQAMTDRAEVVKGWLIVHGMVNAGVLSSLGGEPKTPTTITLDATDCGLRYRAGQPDTFADVDLIAAHRPRHLTPNSCFPTRQDAEQFGQGLTQELSVTEQKSGRSLRAMCHEQVSRARSRTPLIVHRARLSYFDTIGQSEQVALEWASRLGPAAMRRQAKPLRRLLLQPKANATPQPVPTPARPAIEPVLS